MQRLIKDRDFSQEFSITFVRSAGPGGQHVNKVSTQAILTFSVLKSQLLSESEKKLIFARLANRISNDGVLTLRCQEHRSQLANRRAIIKKFEELLQKSIQLPKKRIATKISRAVHEKRLSEKRRKSETKANRGKLNPRQFL